jgi:hypothetical protein
MTQVPWISSTKGMCFSVKRNPLSRKKQMSCNERNSFQGTPGKVATPGRAQELLSHTKK